MKSVFNGVEHKGNGLRTMFDRRPATWIKVSPHLFNAQYKDEDKVTEIQVNPEFTLEQAAIEANFYGEAIGRMPKCLRKDVLTVWIHKGGPEHLFGGGNNNILIHTGMGQIYVKNGELDAALMHEGVHTSLDNPHLLSSSYKAAQAADSNNFVSPYAQQHPEREDLAETFEPWFLTRYRKDSMPTEMYDRITSLIPNRLSFLDSLNLDISPNY